MLISNNIAKLCSINNLLISSSSLRDRNGYSSDTYILLLSLYLNKGGVLMRILTIISRPTRCRPTKCQSMQDTLMLYQLMYLTSLPLYFFYLINNINGCDSKTSHNHMIPFISPKFSLHSVF
jgi:hypothetical protein